MKAQLSAIQLLLTLVVSLALPACDQKVSFKSSGRGNGSTSVDCDAGAVRVIGGFVVEQNVPAKWEYRLERVQWYIIFPDGERIFEGSVLELTLSELGEYPGVVWGFDECNVRQQQNFTIKVVPKLSGPKIAINNDAAYTRLADVQLDLSAENATEMKIGDSPRCASGTWEPYATVKAHTLAAEGLDRRVYVQYRSEAATTACVSDGIIFDKTPPAIKFVKVPAAQSPNLTAVFEFTATDEVSGIKDVSCAVDGGVPQNCSDELQLTNLAYGKHSIGIQATDQAGNESATLTYEFERTNPAPVVRITSAPPNVTTDKTAAFAFSGEDDGAITGYLCSLDAAAAVACASPIVYQGLVETPHEFSVRAVDSEGVQSAPAVHKWTVKKEEPPPPVPDAPIVKITKAPADDTLDPVAIFQFTVIHPGVALKGTFCRLDNAAFGPCTSPKNYGSLLTGRHTFSVYAVDTNNLSSNIATHSWNIAKPRVPVEQTFTIDSTGRKLDIVVVIDNSPSMVEEQKKIGDRFATFIGKLTKVDWQLAIITTDAKEGSKDYQGGKFVPFRGMPDVFAINKSTPKVVEVFAKTVRRKEWGSSTEQGIYAFLKAITRPANQFFFRDQSHVASIIVSDEDERSDGTGLKNVNQPDNLVSSFKTQFGSKNTYSNHSIVLPKGARSTSKCPQVGSFHAGETYMKLSRLTDGIIGDLCEKDYGLILQGIADNIMARTYSAILTCVPDGRVTVKITPAPATPIATTIDGTTLTLSPHPALGSKVDVTYYCQ